MTYSLTGHTQRDNGEAVNLQWHALLERTARGTVLSAIRERLLNAQMTLPQAIEARNLYFRVSLLGHCNLSCPFCHNEGAPRYGRLDIAFGLLAIEAAKQVGFTRVQFTGGEPTLHPQLASFVERARRVIPDVGITTNGVLLGKRIGELVSSGITRIHVSLQAEALASSGSDGNWHIPEWLAPVLERSISDGFVLRINLPVAHHDLEPATHFMRDLAAYQCDIRVFSILPEGLVRELQYPVDKLRQIVETENGLRAKAAQRGKVYLREYQLPSGIRCSTCLSAYRCKEQSHSLRLGSDRILRPCLATRVWDSELHANNAVEQVEEGALLALDYRW